MPDNAARAEHYHNKAEETRIIAESMKSAEAKAFLMRVSGDYIMLARAVALMDDPLPASE